MNGVCPALCSVLVSKDRLSGSSRSNGLSVAIMICMVRLRAESRPISLCIGDRDGTSLNGERETDCALGTRGGD